MLNRLTNKLFPAVRKTARTLNKSARIGIETLEDRSVPATFSYHAAAGTLLINGTAGNDTLKLSIVTAKGMAQLTLTDNGATKVIAHQLAGKTAFHNVTVTMKGNDGNDVLTNATALPAKIYGGNGNDRLYGGSGNDFLYGGNGNDSLYGYAGQDYLNGQAGNDTLLGGAGNDRLYGSLGNDRAWGGDGDDYLSGGPGANRLLDAVGKNTFSKANSQVFTLASAPLTDAQLNADGNLMVFQQDSALIFEGPSTGGFRLEGTWAASTDALHHEVFKATSKTISLVTALGKIAIPNLRSLPITVVTKADTFAGSGVFAKFTLGGSSGIPLNVDDPTAPLGKLAKQFGIDLSLPGVSWGVALGGDLDNLDLPLAKGQPYFFVNLNANPGITYGGFSVGTGFSSGALAIDPSDPSLLVRAGDFAFGGSLRGYIPFVPNSLPSYLAAKGFQADEPVGYGNLYGAGAIDLGGLPVSLSGNVVLGLNTSRNGAPLGISGNEAATFFNGKGEKSLTKLFDTALSNVFVGVNGTVELGYEKAGFDLSVEVGKGSLVYKSKALSVRAETTNPFEGTVLEKVIKPTVAATADGYIDGSGNFSLDMDYSNGQGTALGLGNVASANGKLHLGNSGFHADLTVNPLSFLGNGSTISLSGDIQANGNFSFTAGWDASFNAGVADLASHVDVTLSNTNGTVAFGAHLNGSLSVNAALLRGTVSVGGDLNLSVGSSGVTVSGSGSASVSAQNYVFDFTTFTSHWNDIGTTSVSFSFDNHGFSFSLPFGLSAVFGDVKVSW